MSIKKQYTQGDLTINWEPENCIHSKKCWKELPQVFNPKARPWLNLDGAEKQAIKAQVNACPSGALSLENNNTTETDMNKTKIALAKNGPLLISQDIILIDDAGAETIRKGPVALCRCGASSKKPFCDGAHKNSGFEG